MSTSIASGHNSKRAANQKRNNKGKKKPINKSEPSVPNSDAEIRVADAGEEQGNEDDDEDDDQADDIVGKDGHGQQSKPGSTVSDQDSTTRNKPAEQDSAISDPSMPVHINGDSDLITQFNGEAPESGSDPSSHTLRLEAMQKERDGLREQVSQLRQSLEALQTKHNEDLSGIKEELEQSQQEREHAETQYRNLLGKVSTIRSQLGDRLKADAAELEQARERILQLESANGDAQQVESSLHKTISQLESKIKEHESETESLRSRNTLSTTNWTRERDELFSREAYLKEEYEVARQAMQDWEILATEERSRREALEERVADLEEQLGTLRESQQRSKAEAELQGTTVEGLQRALREMQDERRRELREMVEQSEAQLDQLRVQAKSAEEAAATLQTQLAAVEKELARTSPFEKEVKEKNLLIGKLRHEAVILNDHLTKALRFLKRGKPEDNVDRQLITNHFIHFLALDRSDPKKFQVLQLIAALLGWDDQQKEQAGLVRQGATTTATAGSLKLPISPFRRTPSTPSLTSEYLPQSPSAGGKESLAELWSDFLEREAEAGSSLGSPVMSKKSPSISSHLGLTSPLSIASQPLSLSSEAKRG